MTEVASLRDEQRNNEEAALPAAQQCIEKSRTCGLHHCLQLLAKNFPNSVHLPSLRTKADACALPNGLYRAVRGYQNPRGTECRAHYDIPSGRDAQRIDFLPE